jgi:sec-independent protein translocase protein TatC
VLRRQRPIGHEDRLTLVEHLDELRTRIIISVAAFVVAFALCFWQNDRLLDIANKPLPGHLTPITFGVAEPFTTTVTISAYAALVISLPVILYQAYAFVLPAFSPRERRVALPLMAMIPVLFLIGAVFGYFLVLPAAIGFLQNFNSDEFDVLVQAKSLYSFSIITLIVMGVLFQLPVGVLALTRLGIVTPRQLRRNWRYATVIIAVIAVLLPGTDPVTTCIEMIPMLVLYGVSILLAMWVERLDRRAEVREAQALDETD